MRITLLAALLAAVIPLPALAQALPPPAALPGDSAEDAKLKKLFYDSDGTGRKKAVHFATLEGNPDLSRLDFDFI